MAMATAKLLLLMVLVAGSSCDGSAWRGPLSRLRMLPTAQYVVEAAAERLKEDVSAAAPLIHALHPLLGSAGDFSRRAGVPCDSWRLAVEAYNNRDWKTVPANCDDYVGHYMLDRQYRRDSGAGAHMVNVYFLAFILYCHLVLHLSLLVTELRFLLLLLGHTLFPPHDVLLFFLMF